MDLLQDILAAIGVVLNGIPQGLLALSYGFASVPTGIGFAIGAVACGALNSVAPISFQAETIVMAGSVGKNRRERLSMVMFGGIIMVVLGLTGALSAITSFAGTREVVESLGEVYFPVESILHERASPDGSNKVPIPDVRFVLFGCGKGKK